MSEIINKKIPIIKKEPTLIENNSSRFNLIPNLGSSIPQEKLLIHKKHNLKRARLVVCNQVYQAECDNELISVNMGSPTYVDNIDRLNESKYSIEKDGLVVTLDELGSDLMFSFIPLSIGNDHCIVFSSKSINCLLYTSDAADE